MTNSTNYLQVTLERFHRESRKGEFDTFRYRCRYFIWGEGSPLILIHGMNDRAISFAPTMEGLIDRFRCITYELPNGDDDGSSTRKYRLEHYVEDLIALLNHLQFNRVHLFGSSFGSMIALKALHSYPDHFEKAVLQGGFARRPLGFAERMTARFGILYPGRIGSMPFRESMLKKLDAPAFANAPQEIWQFYIENSGVTRSRAVARRALLLHRTDLRPILSEIPHPLLMIGGDNDLLVPKQYEEEVLKGVPHSRRVEFAQCGHYPQYTRTEDFAKEIRNFLSE